MKINFRTCTLIYPEMEAADEFVDGTLKQALWIFVSDELRGA